MSDAANRLAFSRRAILEQIRRRRDPRLGADPDRGMSWEEDRKETHGRASGERGRGNGRFTRFRRAVSAWWRHHPAHLGLELATPALSEYAARRPFRYLGIAAAVGALVMITRPWRMVSATGLLLALAKSSQLSGLVMSALSVADYARDGPPDL